MSQLKDTPANLNKSVFYDSLHRISSPDEGYSKLNDGYILRQIITKEHLHKLSNICFNKCVTNFSQNEFSADESACINSCKDDGLKGLYNFQFMPEK